MTCGFSRDDAEAKFLPLYVSQGILPSDPFEELDTTGVGELIQIAAQRGRETRPGLHLGICGELSGWLPGWQLVAPVTGKGVECWPAA